MDQPQPSSDPWKNLFDQAADAILVVRPDGKVAVQENKYGKSSGQKQDRDSCFELEVSGLESDQSLRADFAIRLDRVELAPARYEGLALLIFVSVDDDAAASIEAAANTRIAQRVFWVDEDEAIPIASGRRQSAGPCGAL